MQLERTGDGLKHRTDRPGYDPNLYKSALSAQQEKEIAPGDEERDAKKARVDGAGGDDSK